MKARRLPGPLLAASLLLPPAILASLWIPLVEHYRVDRDRIDDTALERSRSLPDDATLEEIASSGTSLAAELGTADRQRLADRLLAGRLEMPGFPAVPLRLPFDPADLERGPPTLQLLVAALAVPALLLDAHEVTGSERYLDAARDALVGFDRYAGRAWFPRGYLWNDHAISARVAVAARFWRVYRRHPRFEPAVGRTILEAVARDGRMLAKPGHFTFRTNHGLLQNLALWQIAIAFPELPGREEFRALAARRLDDQIPWFVGPDGVVREHSAGYQEFGVRLLELVLRYAALLDEPLPAAAQERAAAAVEVWRALRRPDGTLPLLGDTKEASRRVDPVPPARDSLAADDGAWAVWWSGLTNWPGPAGLAQTLVTWADHPARSHKHADEMAVVVWADGRSWWTGVGYWPFGEARRAAALSWCGSNAPHLVGESARAMRETRVVRRADGAGLRAIDLERRAASGAVLRRQVVHATPGVWAVIDRVEDPASGPWRSCWTTWPDVELRDHDGAFVLEAPGASSVVELGVTGTKVPRLSRLRGSEEPFGGWIVPDTVIEPTTTLVVEQAAGEAVALVWRLETGDKTADRRAVDGLRFEALGEPESWRLSTPEGRAALALASDAARLVLRGPGSVEAEAAWTDRDARIETPASVAALHRELARRYPVFRDLTEYRREASWWLLGLFLAQEATLLVTRRALPALVPWLRLAAVLAWIALGFWLHLVHFAV